MSSGDVTPVGLQAIATSLTPGTYLIGLCGSAMGDPAFFSPLWTLSGYTSVVLFN